MQTVSPQNWLGFIVLCLIWGATWIGIKAGIESVPPLLFAGTRFVTAGVLLLIFAALRREKVKIAPRDRLRFGLVSLLMISLCYGPLFWGMQFVNSGTAAVLEMSLTPIALLLFALLLREEKFDLRHLMALSLGVAGLCLLFGPDALAANNGPAADVVHQLVGALAVASAAFTYGLGSVIARPLLRTYPPFFVAGITTLLGGAVLLGYSLIFEDGAVAALSGNWGAAAWGGWLFLVLFGSLIGYTLYMRLLRDIGASRAGSYAFVSPAVAVLLGMAAFGETVQLLDVPAMILMLAGAYMGMRKADLQGDAPSPSSETPGK
jgi:drug/metabolite transporter (DMT)-like permease